MNQQEFEQHILDKVIDSFMPIEPMKRDVLKALKPLIAEIARLQAEVQELKIVKQA